jgi:ketosteroid isomerase-like protein
MTNIRFLLTCAALQFLLVPCANAELSATQQREIITQCQQLVTDYAYYRDLRDANSVAELFAEDARMLARGHWSEGRQAIRDHVNGDDMNTVSMHLITTIKIMPQDDNSATGVTYAAVAHEPKNTDPAAPTELHDFAVVGKYFDTFTRTDEGWKISERIFKPVFRKPDPEVSN